MWFALISTILCAREAKPIRHPDRWSATIFKDASTDVHAFSNAILVLVGEFFNDLIDIIFSIAIAMAVLSFYLLASASVFSCARCSLFLGLVVPNSLQLPQYSPQAGD
jgi:hypothetical protein